MAFIMDIRQKLGPIIVIIIGLSLGIFVLQTAISSNTSLLRGSRDVVGVVDGDKVHYNDYMQQVSKAEETYKLNQNQPITDNVRYSIREQAWNQMITDRINGDMFDKLGITVSQAEMQEMFFGKDPNAEIKKTFTNPNTGIFDPTAVKNYISTLDKSVQGEDVNEKRSRWINFETYVREDRLQSKLRALFHAGVYIPKWLAEEDYNTKNTKYNVDYVSIPLTTISDSAVKVTDEDIQKYLDENKEKYKQPESRKVEYVVFTVNPTADDTAAARKFVDEAQAKLSESQIDTNYVKLNADRAMDPSYYPIAKVPEAPLKDTLFLAPVGSVVGPIASNGSFYVAKIVDRVVVSDSVKASHILFATQGATDTVALKAKADSVFNAVKSGANFEELAKKYSDDKGSGQKGGDLGWVHQGQTVKAFNDFLFFKGHQGEIQLLKTEFGWHIVKIMEASVPQSAVKYYVFSRPVEASSKSDKMVFEQANQFASKHGDAATFTTAMKATDNKFVRQTAEAVRKSDFQLPGLENARELVTWAYKSEVGAISPVIASDNKYVIGHLVEAREEGTPSVAAIRPQVEPMVRNKKKAEMLAAQVAQASAMGTTLESIAAKYNTEVKNQPELNVAEGYVPGVGADPAFFGNVAAAKQGTVSKPIAGAGGVYLIRVNSVTKPQPVADYNAVKMAQVQNVAPRIEYGITEALKKNMKIDDRRYNFF